MESAILLLTGAIDPDLATALGRLSWCPNAGGLNSAH